MTSKSNEISGLTEEQVLASRKEFGENVLSYKKEYFIVQALKGIFKEPMIVLLLATSTIYFIVGEFGDGIFLASAIVLVAAISLFQDSRSRNALEKLKQLTQPKSKVIRDGKTIEINSSEIVVGDSLMVEEGSTVAADGTIVSSNDFSVDESLLTGESLSVQKDAASTDNAIYSGTKVASGLAIATVTAIGTQTKLGKIGESLESIVEEKSPLEIQINSFVKKMVLFGALVFLVVWGINYNMSHDLLDSLLKALTLAMSILPEEIPVAFTTFMALGAWRLMKMGIVVKQMKTVETLGSATVICTDKTGTITENKMSLAKIFLPLASTIKDATEKLTAEEKELITVAMWASEPIPFDPMEIALHKAYQINSGSDERAHFNMLHEYPLSGKPPMMTHVFEDAQGKRIIAAKGAAEGLLNISDLSPEERTSVEKAITQLADDGYRILGVASATFSGTNFPSTQQEFAFHFKGLVAFYDPPKKNIASVLEHFYDAGLGVKLITGDYAATTSAIAKQVHFKHWERHISGEELMQLDEQQLRENVNETSVFTRMFPEAKLKIINALKANNEVVAMTGDGVNDGPALKAAHIGIAMGKTGTEIAKQSASLILMEDDLAKMVDAIAMGRRIYDNLKKAIRYIISIHIPIILTVFIPLVLGWVYPNIFTPVHIILLELIMGPTCSIIYENEPMEKNIMQQKPRPFSSTFFNWKELSTSVIQGLAITAGTLLAYQMAVHQQLDEELTRTIVFTVLISANIFLTLVNRSFYFSILTTAKYKNNLVGLIIGISVTIAGLLLYVHPFTEFFKFKHPNGQQLGLSIVIGFASVIWFEAVKWWRRKFQVQKRVL